MRKQRYQQGQKFDVLFLLSRVSLFLFSHLSSLSTSPNLSSSPLFPPLRYPFLLSCIIYLSTFLSSLSFLRQIPHLISLNPPFLLFLFLLCSTFLLVIFSPLHAFAFLLFCPIFCLLFFVFARICCWQNCATTQEVLWCFIPLLSALQRLIWVQPVTNVCLLWRTLLNQEEPGGVLGRLWRTHQSSKWIKANTTSAVWHTLSSRAPLTGTGLPLVFPLDHNWTFHSVNMSRVALSAGNHHFSKLFNENNWIMLLSACLSI